MRNFPTHFWRRFQDFKDDTAFVFLDERGTATTQTYWEWTRRVQRLAIALQDQGFDAGTRLGIVAPNSRDWIDLAFATWLVGGCVVPIPPDLSRTTTLRCLARSGCEWIAVDTAAGLDRLRGQGGNIPDHLRWISFDAKDLPERRRTFSVEALDEKGRSLAVRGRVKDLAQRTYELPADLPTLILFEPDPGADPHGAFFKGNKLGRLLQWLGGDLPFDADDRLAVLLGYGWFQSVLMTVAALLEGVTVITGESISEVVDGLATLQPTHLVCGPAYLEGKTAKIRDQLEEAPEFLRSEEDSTSTISSALTSIGRRAARRLFYDPLRAEFGGKLQDVYLIGGTLPDDVHDVLESTGLKILGLYGTPECGISHLERPGAQRRNSVGRPVPGYVCKIADAKGAETGEVLIRTEVVFDDYWDGDGPRELDDEGWLQTGDVGRVESGYLFLE